MKNFFFKMLILVFEVTRSKFFEIFSSLQVPFGDPPHDLKKQTLVLVFGANSAIVPPNWTFFHVLAHCDFLTFINV